MSHSKADPDETKNLIEDESPEARAAIKVLRARIPAQIRNVGNPALELAEKE